MRPIRRHLSPPPRARGDRAGTGVESPCVRNCCLDDDDVCLGCGRHLQEILDWNGASEADRATINLRAGQRLATRRAG